LTLTLILQLNLGIIREKTDSDAGIFGMIFYGICLLVIWGIQMYAFPALSRFDMPAGWIFKLSLFLCFRHLGRTVILVAVTGGAIILVYYFLPLLLVLPFAVHLVYHFMLEPVLSRHMPVDNPCP
jgi:uncharacterized membrane protein YesL